MLTPTLINLRWESVREPVTLWEISIDGVKVATAGPKVRTTKVSIKDGSHTVSVVDLPNRSEQQTIELISEDS